MEVRTRIAPSPTGKLHIGIARTALFNYLYAKKNKGKFFLRFEDTDQKRSTKEFEKDIGDNLKWLGFFWDGEIVYQMERVNKYSKKAEELLDKGFAYEKDGAIWFDVKKAMDDLNISGREVEARREDKVIKSTLIELPEPDLIQGKISGNVEDFVIVRSNGIPTFHFAVVIDDNEMGITHVIRGVDHFANTPKHFLLYKIFGYTLPRWAHIALTLNEDKSKLSKRKGVVSVSDFKKEGYLPEALNNFIVLLGWYPGKGVEDEIFLPQNKKRSIFDELLRWINWTYDSMDGMQKSNAIFDRKKLDYFNGVAIRLSDNQYIIQKMKDIMKMPKVNGDYLDKVLTVTKDRMKKLTDFSDLSYCFFNEPEYKSEILIFKKSDIKNTKKGLSSAIDELGKLSQWPKSPDQIKKILQQRMEKEELSFGDMFWPVRVALSGKEQSPSPDELLWVLGKDTSLKRLEKAANLLK